jgi:hypothetical protein
MRHGPRQLGLILWAAILLPAKTLLRHETEFNRMVCRRRRRRIITVCKADCTPGTEE